MKEQKYPTAFPLKHQRKDLELALKYAESTQQSLPVAAATTELYKKVCFPFGTFQPDSTHHLHFALATKARLV